MSDKDWKNFLLTCIRVLGAGNWEPYLSSSWCAFTTFSSLEHNVLYFNCGFPNAHECLDSTIADGGVWRQSLAYADLAHIIIPRKFYWESIIDGNFECGYKTQDINLLSHELAIDGIGHRITKQCLEIKLY